MKSYLRSQFHAELARNGKIDKAIDYLVQQTALQIFGEIDNINVENLDKKTVDKISKSVVKIALKWG